MRRTGSAITVWRSSTVEVSPAPQPFGVAIDTAALCHLALEPTLRIPPKARRVRHALGHYEQVTVVVKNRFGVFKQGVDPRHVLLVCLVRLLPGDAETPGVIVQRRQAGGINQSIKE